MRTASCFTLCLLLPLVIAGCGGEVSWKRGAREQDWAADRIDCAKRSDFIECMADRGWSVTNLGDGREASGAAAAFFDPDAAMAGTAEAMESEPVQSDVNRDPDNLRATEAVTAASPASPDGSLKRVRPVTVAPSPDGLPRAAPSPQTLARVQGSEGTEGVAKRAARAPVAPRDPLDRVEVNSWWKLGGRAGEVEQQTAACLEKLGPEHAPQGPMHTLGMLSCLKEKGWRALTVTASE
jgi:hypothetical protein